MWDTLNDLTDALAEALRGWCEEQRDAEELDEELIELVEGAIEEHVVIDIWRDGASVADGLPPDFEGPDDDLADLSLQELLDAWVSAMEHLDDWWLDEVADLADDIPQPGGHAERIRGLIDMLLEDDVDTASVEDAIAMLDEPD